jgi:hypothetical protein
MDALWIIDNKFMQVRCHLLDGSLVVRECRQFCEAVGIDYEQEFAENQRFITLVQRIFNAVYTGIACAPPARPHEPKLDCIPQPPIENNL